MAAIEIEATIATSEAPAPAKKTKKKSLTDSTNTESPVEAPPKTKKRKLTKPVQVSNTPAPAKKTKKKSLTDSTNTESPVEAPPKTKKRKLTKPVQGPCSTQDSTTEAPKPDDTTQTTVAIDSLFPDPSYGAAYSGGRSGWGVTQRCSTHGKTRSADSMHEVDGKWECTPDQPCKAGKDKQYEQCTVHGATRLADWLLQQPDGTWKCTPGDECKGGSASAGGKYLCAAHGRTRNESCLQQQADGTWQCAPGFECGGTASGGWAEPRMCSLHGRTRRSDFLTKQPDGSWHCQLDNECKGGSFNSTAPVWRKDTYGGQSLSKMAASTANASSIWLGGGGKSSPSTTDNGVSSWLSKYAK
eukprot:NODE_2337_length_1208_cov_154.116559_g2223_i0.p1 GENE.NODE_2337_length_1208_cov_154.116559_g2223_i0~~NODE_2337_length_1208_cov_154.116559_g2223_i0.p1  ORF type:complete len:375 (+),score=86.87 NODE_2337_length_1208_cov_154.116559_g2223_i0:55-1125(+)